MSNRRLLPDIPVIRKWGTPIKPSASSFTIPMESGMNGIRIVPSFISTPNAVLMLNFSVGSADDSTPPAVDFTTLDHVDANLCAAVPAGSQHQEQFARNSVAIKAVVVDGATGALISSFGDHDRIIVGYW